MSINVGTITSHRPTERLLPNPTCGLLFANFKVCFGRKDCLGNNRGCGFASAREKGKKANKKKSFHRFNFFSLFFKVLPPLAPIAHCRFIFKTFLGCLFLGFVLYFGMVVVVVVTFIRFNLLVSCCNSLGRAATAAHIKRKGWKESWHKDMG